MERESEEGRHTGRHAVRGGYAGKECGRWVGQDVAWAVFMQQTIEGLEY